MNFNTFISKIKTEFSLKNSTSFGGSKIFLEYLEKIKLSEALKNLNCTKSPNSVFPVHKILLYLIIGWTLGCERIFHFRKLQHDSLIKRFLGGRCPQHTLLYKELGRLSQSSPTLNFDLRRLNILMIQPCLPTNLILDLDSTVETVYGDQQGAAVGANSHKPGRKSYHPLLAFEGQSRLCLNGTLREGNSHSSKNANQFVEETLAMLSTNTVKYARFDKGFGGEDFYRLWESKNIGYVGKMKWTQRLQDEVKKCRYWTRFVDDDWIIEGIAMIYRATSWKKSRMVIVIRKAKHICDDQKQLIFESDWDYEAIVTNLDWQPIDIFHFYNQRACMENYIKEVKNGFSIHRIATGSFKSNELDMLIKLIAYNLYERFKTDCCEPIHQCYTIARFRMDFFYCAGVLIKHSRRVVLKLTKDFANKYIWKRMAIRVAALE